MSSMSAAILDFSKKFIVRKTAANFIEISRKHVFVASNRNIIKIRVKKEIRTNFLKNSQFYTSNFNLHN